MDGQREPIEQAADDSVDLYDVATWEPRSVLDRLSTVLYRWVLRLGRALIITVALIILIAQFVLSGFATVVNPTIGIFVFLSIIPAFLIAFYVWQTDVTIREPLPMLVATFLLGVLFAGFAGILNTIAQPVFTAIPVIGLLLFFYIIVAPVEETVKWLAIRLHAYRSTHFNAVLDGAVYGAVAGLGFATIENTIYIGNQYLLALQSTSGAVSPLEAVVPITAARTLAGPGHVLYSAFAGYYLGLAKFNPDNAGPIIVKGLFVATIVHATYNSIVTYLPGILGLFGITIPLGIMFLLVIVLYDGAFGYILYRKIARYRRVYRNTVSGTERTISPSSTEQHSSFQWVDSDASHEERSIEQPTVQKEGDGSRSRDDQ